eukprot:Gb_18202 [translate_table: standard]
MAEAIATGAAANVLSTLFLPIIHRIDDLIHLNSLQSQQSTVPQSVRVWLESVQDALQTAEQIVHNYASHDQQCPSILFQRDLDKKIRQWRTETDRILQLGDYGFSIMANIQQAVSSAPHDKEGELLQPVPETGFVGLQIQSAQKKLQSWLMEDVKVHVIGVYGMGGIGKTSLLKNIYNNQEVRKFFDVVIWATVSQNVNVFELQDCIALRIDVDLSKISNIDMRKMELYKKLKEMKFLVVLDDLWEQLNQLEVLGVESVKAGGSKIVITTRDEKVCWTMRADKRWKMQPLVEKEGWELFIRGADVQADVEDIAKKVALECKGLPLAISVVSTAMRGLSNRREWELALNQMRTVDPSFSTTHSGIENNLYKPLRWSYDALPDPNLKMCFLCCAMSPEDRTIDSERLIEMWIAEGLVKSREQGYLFDTGRSYLQFLIDPSLVESTSRDDSMRGVVPCIKMHDVLRDLAVYIGEKEENYLFRAGELQCLKRLNLGRCLRLAVIPRGISQLTSLESLRMPDSGCALADVEEDTENCSFSELRKLKDLRECEISIKSAIRVGASCVGDVAKSKEIRNNWMSEIENVGGGVWETRCVSNVGAVDVTQVTRVRELVASKSNKSAMAGVFEDNCMRKFEEITIGNGESQSLKRLLVEREWWDEIIVRVDDAMRNHLRKRVTFFTLDF